MTDVKAVARRSAKTPSRNVHVSVRGVAKTFEREGGQEPVQALDLVDLDLKEGEFFSIVGPSGCGKSTLLEIIAGLARPTSGTVRIEGREVAGVVPEGVGMLFQEDATFPWLTVRDNIAFGLHRKGVPRRDVAERVEAALRLMGLTGFGDAYPAQLSGGMRQRVCIARTFVLEPRTILLDEPFGALDQQTRLLMGDELLRLWRETGATILLVTHALDEAAMLSDRVGVMSARPGRFIDIVATEWEEDRDSRLVARPEFGAVTGRLWALLREESLKAIAPSGAGGS